MISWCTYYIAAIVKSALQLQCKPGSNWVEETNLRVHTYALGGEWNLWKVKIIHLRPFLSNVLHFLALSNQNLFLLEMNFRWHFLYNTVENTEATNKIFFVNNITYIIVSISETLPISTYIIHIHPSGPLISSNFYPVRIYLHHIY